MSLSPRTLEDRIQRVVVVGGAGFVGAHLVDEVPPMVVRPKLLGPLARVEGLARRCGGGGRHFIPCRRAPKSRVRLPSTRETGNERGCAGTA